MISGALVVAVVTIAVVASLFASLAGESQSYRDGYSAGGSAYTAYGDSSVTSTAGLQGRRGRARRTTRP